MAFPKSILKPEGSIMAGIATAALAYGVYSTNVGNLAQAHATPAGDNNMRAARKKAAIEAVAVVAAVSLLTRDITIFVLGGGVVVLLDWHARHAIEASPQTGQVPAASGSYGSAQNVVPTGQQGAAVSYDGG